MLQSLGNVMFVDVMSLMVGVLLDVIVFVGGLVVVSKFMLGMIWVYALLIFVVVFGTCEQLV